MAELQRTKYAGAAKFGKIIKKGTQEAAWFKSAVFWVTESYGNRQSERAGFGSNGVLCGRQVAIGLWKPKSRRVRRVFQLRDRRPRFGELIQIDGSPHDWFEGRGPRCTLIVFIDDATSRLTALRFAPVESTRAYLETLQCHVLEHGCPLAFYSDRHWHFPG